MVWFSLVRVWRGEERKGNKLINRGERGRERKLRDLKQLGGRERGMTIVELWRQRSMWSHSIGLDLVWSVWSHSIGWVIWVACTREVRWRSGKNKIHRGSYSYSLFLNYSFLLWLDVCPHPIHIFISFIMPLSNFSVDSQSSMCHFLLYNVCLIYIYCYLNWNIYVWINVWTLAAKKSMS